MSRVLLVESDAALAEAIAQSLHRAGWQVEHRAALEPDWRCSETRPPQAVLVDVSGPQGFDRLGRLASVRAGWSIVAMGAGASTEAAARARRLGADAFLRKPFGLDALEAVLADAVAAPPCAAGMETAELATRSPAMQRTLDALRAAASTDATIQLVGELGTGKRELARRVHAWSPRRAAPLRRVDCAGLARDGLDAFEVHGGTLLLEDVDAMPLDLQPVLLQRLQDRADGREGRAARIVVTTRRSLAGASRAGLFLDALHRRLDVIRLEIPPLRDRLEDLPELAGSMLAGFAVAHGVAPPTLPESALEALASQRFSGNLRELSNWMRRAVVLFPGEPVDVDRLLGRGSARRAEAPSRPLALDTLNLREIERQAVLRSLAEHGGHRTRASEALGISVRTLRNKIREYGLA